ncbi:MULTISPECIES: hypothetical protein [unclassified Nostoc]|uniref:hypothetical protein n=1 Tax=unclassified Nostoc TaxID=2593658 RepID=UPI001D44C678|nr:hypothetical protein [Nostoc sp. JL23]MBN3879451.1 hypothetical protein [Nostoc sp. JL23]
MGTTPLFLAIRIIIYSRSPVLTDYISSKTYYDRRIIPQKNQGGKLKIYTRLLKDIKFSQYLPDSAIPG